MPVSISGTNGVTFPDSSLQTAAASPYVLKNRIINGDMRIDQRNAGAVQTFSTSAYSLDRYRFGLNNATAINCQQVSDAPNEFSFSLKVTCISAVTPTAAQQNQLKQFVEGFNWADMAFGTANAKTATFSFWVKSSLTGTFGGSFLDNNSTLSYPFSYTVNSANTWEYKTITFAGPTSGGTWNTTNGVGIQICFNIGSGTNFEGAANTWSSGNFLTPAGTVNINGTLNATWQVTGVQLEIGSTATPFERRLYNQELAACQRYYWRISGSSGGFGYTSLGSGVTMSTTSARIYIKHPTSMRASPTVAYGGTLTVDTGTGTSISALGSTYAGIDTLMQDFTTSGQTANRGAIVYTQNASTNYLEAISEL
jgi:hypothetical protein